MDIRNDAFFCIVGQLKLENLSVKRKPETKEGEYGKPHVLRRYTYSGYPEAGVVS